MLAGFGPQGAAQVEQDGGALGLELDAVAADLGGAAVDPHPHPAHRAPPAGASRCRAVAEGGVGVGVGQDRGDLGQRGLGRDAEVAGRVQGGDGGGAGLGGHAVQQHGPPLGAQPGDGVGGLGQHVVEVRVAGRVCGVDQPHLHMVGRRDPGGRGLVGAEPAQRHHRVHPVGQIAQGVHPAEPDPVVVGMPGESVRPAVLGVVEH